MRRYGQIIGAALGGLALWGIFESSDTIAKGKLGSQAIFSGASNGWAEHSPGGFAFGAMVITEILFTALFVLVIAGTTRKSAIAGFAAAAEAAGGAGRLAPLRDAIEVAAAEHGALALGGPDRLPNTCCFALPGVRADTQVIALDLAGVQVSAGAACSSGKVARSHVLDAMGAGELAGQAIRVSLPWNAEAADVAAFAAAYAAMARHLARRVA